MICVTIGRGRHSSLAEEWKQAAEAGVDLVELRIDCLRREPDLKRILKDRPTPLVFTIRRGSRRRISGVATKTSGSSSCARPSRWGSITSTWRWTSPPRFAGSARPSESSATTTSKTTPVDLEDIADKCAEFDPDVVKIATSATTLAEASRVLHLATKAKAPMIPIAMGEIGVFTRILGAQFRSPVHLCGIQSRAGLRRRECSTTRPEDTTSRYDEINADTEIYGVIGDPIEQSLSPVVHNAAFRKLGLNKVMVPFLVPNGELPAFFKELLWLDIKGCSVTIPHKEADRAAVATEGGAVERTGSCNTVVFQDDGKRVGYNTDYRAAMDSLEAAMGGRDSEEDASPLFDKQVLILGAGGSGAGDRLRAHAAQAPS